MDKLRGYRRVRKGIPLYKPVPPPPVYSYEIEPRGSSGKDVGETTEDATHRGYAIIDFNIDNKN